MSQLPMIPATQTTKTLAQPAETAGADPASTLGEQAVDAAFLQAMQEVLETSEIEPLAGLGWAVDLPVESALNLQSVLNGNQMPGQSAPGGTSLPLQFRESPLTQPELIKSAALPALNNGFLVEQIIGQADRNQVTATSMITPSTEGLLQGFESRGGELTGAVSLGAVPGLHSPAAARAGQLTLPVNVPVGQAGWDKAVGERIQWMVGRNIQSAEVKLTPPHLGPIEIRVSMQNDQASVSFVAAQLPTREALEAAIPRLREMLGETNINLADVDVGQGSGSDSYNPQGQAGDLPAGSGMRGSNQPDPQGVRLTRLASDGLVDDYA